MSIINQMLKDLEKRTHGPINSDVIASTMPSTVFYPQRNSNNHIYQWIAGIVFLILFLVLSYKIIAAHPVNLANTVSSANVIVQPNMNVPVSPPNAAAVPSLHLTPSILTAITLQVEKDTTSLRFLLSQDSLYQVASHEKNKLSIIIENARLVTSIPPLNAINSGIKEVKIINQQNGDLKVILMLKEGVELTHLEMNQAGKLPELELDLLSTATTADTTQVDKSTNNVAMSSTNNSVIKLRTDISLDDQYQNALQLTSTGHNHDAIKMLTSILNIDPNYVSARESLASLLISEGNVVQAEQVLKIGLKQRPYFPGYVQLRAKILVDEGKVNQALDLLQLAPPTLATNPDYHAFIAALYQQQGKSAFAEKLYEQLLAVQPNNAKWWMGLGIALENMGNTTLAKEAYQRAGNSDQLNPELKIYAASRVKNLQSNEVK